MRRARSVSRLRLRAQFWERERSSLASDTAREVKKLGVALSQRPSFAPPPWPVAMCIQQRIGNTGFWRAQQVRCVATAARDASRRVCALASLCAPFTLPLVCRVTLPLAFGTRSFPTIVMGPADSSSLTQPQRLRVKALNIAGHLGHYTLADVSIDCLSALHETFAPGEAVKRAMLNGNEEDAVVRADWA